MLTHQCVAALRLARLEPTTGGYHISRPGRPAYALDLMEPFHARMMAAWLVGEISSLSFLTTR